MKRMLFVYNPNSGMGLLKPKLSDVIDTFVKGGYEVTVYPTQRSQDAVRKVSEYTEEYDLVTCSGGDGTLDEVVTGMMMRENKTPIGYIPAGTTNDFASSLHISKNMLEAADTIVTGTPFSFDIGQFNDDYFVYIAAFGIFTDVSYETKQSMKNILGHMAYILEGTKRLFNIPSYKIKVIHDGETIEDEFIFGMVTNSRSVGGFKRITGENVIFDDGVFEVMFIRRPKNILELNEIIASLVGTNDSKMIEVFKTTGLTIECEEEISWTLDGEFGGLHKNVTIKNLKHVVQIMLAKNDQVPLINPPE